MDPGLRVLGVLRPTVEALGAITLTRHVGLVGTPGTISSGSYQIEIHKLYPDILLTAEACPMWVPMVENVELDSEGTAYFVRRHVDHVFLTDPFIDTLLLGCTHYPLLLPLIQRYVPEGVRIISQGQYVADSLTDYLRRHPEMEACCTRGGTCRFLTTESEAKFKESAALFIKQPVEAQQIQLGL
jgi:glutamate racemase